MNTNTLVINGYESFKKYYDREEEIFSICSPNIVIENVISDEPLGWIEISSGEGITVKPNTKLVLRNCVLEVSYIMFDIFSEVVIENCKFYDTKLRFNSCVKVTIENVEFTSMESDAFIEFEADSINTGETGVLTVRNVKGEGIRFIALCQYTDKVKVIAENCDIKTSTQFISVDGSHDGIYKIKNCNIETSRDFIECSRTKVEVEDSTVKFTLGEGKLVSVDTHCLAEDTDINVLFKNSSLYFEKVSIPVVLKTSNIEVKLENCKIPGTSSKKSTIELKKVFKNSQKCTLVLEDTDDVVIEKPEINTVKVIKIT